MEGYICPVCGRPGLMVRSGIVCANTGCAMSGIDMEDFILDFADECVLQNIRPANRFLAVGLP